MELLLRELFGSLRSEMTARLDAQDRKLDLIYAESRKTNGRVTALETANAIKADRQERQVRREDYRRGPRMANLIAVGALLISLAAVLSRFL